MRGSSGPNSAAPSSSESLPAIDPTRLAALVGTVSSLSGMLSTSSFGDDRSSFGGDHYDSNSRKGNDSPVAPSISDSVDPLGSFRNTDLSSFLTKCALPPFSLSALISCSTNSIKRPGESSSSGVVDLRRKRSSSSKRSHSSSKPSDQEVPHPPSSLPPLPHSALFRCPTFLLPCALPSLCFGVCPVRCVTSVCGR